MSEEPPILPPEGPEAEEPNVPPKIEGEAIGAPTVPLAKGFEAREVTKLPPDIKEIERVRKSIEEDYGALPRTDLADTGLYRSGASRGHKGRALGAGSDD